jgi:hypothetical protein
VTKAIWSYPKVYSLGHPALVDLLDGEVTVEEKLDGSQFSFGVIAGELRMRSKGQEIVPDAPEKMFSFAAEKALELEADLQPGWVYRCEYLRSPHHNALSYNRVPAGHLALFDIEVSPNDFLDYPSKYRVADDLGLEVVPEFNGPLDLPLDLERFNDLLGSESFLGGPTIEGIVVKNYRRFGRDGKILAGKFVSEAFKEVHEREWKKANPTRTDLVQALVVAHRTEARWQKAVQHLREAGELEDADRDIGKLIREIHRDIDEECAEDIKDTLWKWAAPKIKRGASGGVADWYKRLLAERQFEEAT